MIAYPFHGYRPWRPLAYVNRLQPLEALRQIRVYFYPDLPKGYQISQYELPLCVNGYLDIETEDGPKRIRIRRAHQEEDTGKLYHVGAGVSHVDLNRAGVPLLEIVSEPDMRSSEEAVAYARKIHQIVTFIGICDGNMQEGSFRVDANVSVRPKGQAEFGTRAELKKIAENIAVKVPLTWDGLKACKALSDKGHMVNVTLCFSANQAILAAKAGATRAPASGSWP